MSEFGDKLGLLKPGQVWTMRNAPNPAARVIMSRCATSIRRAASTASAKKRS